MSKPAGPRANHDGVPEKVVEIDAIDEEEWERDRHTPQAPVAGLAALVRQTVPQPVRIEPRPRHAASQPLPVQSPPVASPQAAPAAAPQAIAPPSETQAYAQRKPSPDPAKRARPAEPQADLAHPTLGPSEPTKLRGRPPRPPAKRPQSAPAEIAPALATVPESTPAPTALQLEAAAPQRVAPEVVQLPLHAPPSEPITTPALVIPRPFVVEAEPQLRAQPDHTPAPPARLPLAPPALDSFESVTVPGGSPAFGGPAGNPAGNAAGDGSLDALADTPDAHALRPRFASRRVIALAAITAAAVIAVVAVAATRGSAPGRSSSPTASPAKAGAASSRVVAEVLSPPEPTARAAQPAPPEPAPTTAPEPSPPSPPSATEPAIAAPEPVAPRTVPRLRDEPLVPAKPHRLRTAPGRGVRKAAKAVAVRPVAREEPADPVEDEPSLSRARVAYDAGNQALFAGDSAGAIRAYRQVLGFVPTYAAGFRGLGLAHAQQGDVGAAIMALRTYLTLAPQARDVGLIKKRIAILQAASAAERSAQRTDH